ncbi:hypothetical protein [Pelotalea chapellei]|uniref:Uncharacterized protein n=1 Tax=Pelotalea chapellei TaxID=44671 RepID=A0ABS5UCT5_9BACT|nr:hypothetical protein [Pelotalea chapellei]MBT1073490.1 hypothetical protein [Pelotalea chapellei]
MKAKATCKPDYLDKLTTRKSRKRAGGGHTAQEENICAVVLADDAIGKVVAQVCMESTHGHGY